MFKKIKNKRGEVVELKVGSSLREAMKEEAKKNKRFSTLSDSLVRDNSSALYRSYLESEGVTVKDAVRALGYNDVGMIEVRSLYENDNTKPLFNAVVEDKIRMGYAKAGRAEMLVAQKVPITQMTSEYYTMENVDKEELDFKLIGQGAPIPVVMIKLDDKRTIRVYKRGGGVEITDEAKSMNIDMLALQLQLRGQRMGRTDEFLAISRLLNGYFSDGTDAAPTIGVKVANDLKITDVWYASQYMQEEFGFTPKVAVMNLKTAEMWAEQKNGSSFLFPEELKAGQVPDVINSKPFVSNAIPDNRIMLVDTDFALAEYEYKPFSVENDRNVKTQIEGSYATKSSDYVPFEKNARLILTLDSAR